MPKDTFLNLPEEKRSFIEEVALNEFAEYGFGNASINRIVNAAGIAKGSFYQYFDNKVDIFKHTINVMGVKKMAYISPVLLNPSEHDFFTLLEEIYRSGLAFAKDYPKESKVGFEIYKNQSNPIFQDIFEENRRLGYAFFDPLIAMAIERDEIAADIDKHFIIHILMKLQIASLDYFLENNEQTTFEGDIMATIHLMINFIKNGIQRQ